MVQDENETLKRKNAALEELCSLLLKDQELAADRFAGHARHIVDLMSDDMRESERNAAWILIKYAKKKETEIRNKMKMPAEED